MKHGFIWLINACLIIFVVYWLIMDRGGASTKRKLPMVTRLAMSLLRAIGAILDFVPLPISVAALNARVVPLTPIVAGISLVLAIGGLAIAIWARNVLGANWSSNVIVKEGHELVRNGPYAYMRHPIYTAMLLMLLGYAGVHGTVIVFSGFATLTGVHWWKLRMEEAFMREEFGDAYVRYQREVKALIPGVL
jgi:protein-S-isoprenylcysteine O-methyltransferase Ste14